MARCNIDFEFDRICTRVGGHDGIFSRCALRAVIALLLITGVGLAFPLVIHAEDEPVFCGPDITRLIIDHLNAVIAAPQGDLSWFWPFGALQLEPIARQNSRAIRSHAATTVQQCPVSKQCKGSYTFDGVCISGFHIDHILQMTYIEASYGARTARSAGQYNESFWMGFGNEGGAFEGSSEAVANADLTFNELAISLGEMMQHADENNGTTDELTEDEVNDTFSGADMEVIGKKEAMSGGQGGYATCPSCPQSAPSPPTRPLSLPPVDI